MLPGPFRAATIGTSPSSRRAWIEICKREVRLTSSLVALLAEGVDRNRGSIGVTLAIGMVALLAEGVDRNLLLDVVRFVGFRRPPRGGRG